MSRNRFLSLLGLLALVLLAACSSVTTGPTSSKLNGSQDAGVTGGAALPTSGATSPTPNATAAVAPDAAGPFKVGRETLTLTDPARHRTLTVDVLYPVDAAGVVGRAKSRYEFVAGVGFTSKLAYAGAPASRQGPFPLVVFSHGSDGIRFQSTFLTETLASHGFVVAAPDHAGNTALDAAAGKEASFVDTATNRPKDVSFVITDLLARSAGSGDLLAGRIDPAKIGVEGHSLGGYTALVAPGGIDAAGIDAPADPRVKAVVGLAPAVELLPDATLRADTVPTLLVGGTKDTVVSITPNLTRPEALAPGRPLYRVDITGATHYSFTDVCDYPPILAEAHLPAADTAQITANVPTTCQPPAIPIADAHRIIDVYSVAFFERTLVGGTAYARYLTSAYAASMPEVHFSARS